MLTEVTIHTSQSPKFRIAIQLYSTHASLVGPRDF